MFASDGWKQFVQDLEDGVEVAKSRAFDDDKDHFLQTQAEVKVTNKIINLENIMRAAFALEVDSDGD